MVSSAPFADNLAGMIWECRLLAIGLALSFTGLACSRTPMDQQQVMNTIGTSGGGTTGGTGSTPVAGGSKCATDQNTCVKDDDCTNSDYRPPISSAADCYCFLCGYPVSSALAGDCQSAYDQFCGPNWQDEHGCVPASCPSSFPPVCSEGICKIIELGLP
jgi:hypothetical protein